MLKVLGLMQGLSGNSMNGRILFIPSFGTDSSLYNDIKLSEANQASAIFLDWPAINDAKGLKDYARTFISQFKITKEDILVGTSLGGIVAIEINKILVVKKIIIVSSIKTHSEKPKLFKFMEISRTYKLFVPSVLKIGLDLIVPLYGKNISRYLWFRKVFKKSDNKFMKWGLKQIVCWKNKEVATNLVQIHGSKDPLFPLKYARNPHYIIEGGTHAMVRLKGEELSKVIDQEIS